MSGLLWLALSAALPVTWSPLLVYFGITIILALLDWPGLGRAVRSKLLSLREEDYAAAAQMMGAVHLAGMRAYRVDTGVEGQRGAVQGLEA